MTEKTNGSREAVAGIRGNCDRADKALERVLNRYPYMKDNGDWNEVAALINGIRMMSYELEADNEKPSTAATEDGQTGKGLENEYPSLFEYPYFNT